jgi:hypothetical protein
MATAASYCVVRVTVSGSGPQFSVFRDDAHGHDEMSGAED